MCIRDRTAPLAANLRFAPGAADIGVGIGDSGVTFYSTDELVGCKSGATGVIVGQDEGPGTLDVAVTPDGEYAFVLNEYGDVDGDSVQSHSGSIGVVKIKRDASVTLPQERVCSGASPRSVRRWPG